MVYSNALFQLDETTMEVIDVDKRIPKGDEGKCNLNKRLEQKRKGEMIFMA